MKRTQIQDFEKIDQAKDLTTLSGISARVSAQIRKAKRRNRHYGRAPVPKRTMSGNEDS